MTRTRNASGKDFPPRMRGDVDLLLPMQVLLVDPEVNAIVVKGAIPGKAGNVVEITHSKIVGTNC